MSDRTLPAVPLLIYWLSVVGSAVLVGVLIVVLFRPGPERVLEISTIQIVDQVEQDDGSLIPVVPSVEGIDGPAVVGSAELCGDDEGCFTIPLAFEVNNLTDDDVVAEVLGQWHNPEYGRSCASQNTPFQLRAVPGVESITFPSEPPACVIEDIVEIAAGGVRETVWNLTAIVDPVGGGASTEVVSQNFTIVLP